MIARIALFLVCLFLNIAHAQHYKFRILSLDGGGVRGIIQAEFLRRLGEKTGLRVQDQFHMFAGTSIGGVNALALAAGHSVDNLNELYDRDTEKIFYASYGQKLYSMGGYLHERYEPSGIEEVLKAGFKDWRMSDLRSNLALVVTQNTGKDRPEIIQSWDAKAPWYWGSGIDTSKNIKLWCAARATSAAPSYFPPCQAEYQDGHKETLIDGGLIANNPSEIAMTAAEVIINSGNLRYAPDDIEICLYSVGTGDFADRFTYSSMSTTGILGWINPVVYIATSDKITNQQMSKRLDPSRYFRFNPPLPVEDDQIDNTDLNFRSHLREMTTKYLGEYKRTDEMWESLSSPRDRLW